MTSDVLPLATFWMCARFVNVFGGYICKLFCMEPLME